MAGEDLEPERAVRSREASRLTASGGARIRLAGKGAPSTRAGSGIGRAIALTCVPGYGETFMTAPLSPAARQTWTMGAPLKKAGKPTDVAAAALDLASADADFVTGQIPSPNGDLWMP